MDTREALLQNALDLFSSKGYSSVGIQSIIDRVGVSKPTLYHHFGSKAGLLKALFTERLQPFIDALRQEAAYRGDLVKTLESVISLYFRATEEQPRIFRLLLALALGPREDEAVAAAHSIVGEQFRILEGLFEAAIPDHGNLRGKAPLLARTLYGMTTAYCGLALHGGETPDNGTVFALCKQFMHGIYS